MGNSETCKNQCEEGIKSLPYPSLAKGNTCKPYGGLNVVIGDCDPLGSFALRNTGFNSIHTTAASMSVVRFISVQATDNAARPSELVKRAYELRPLKIDRRYQRSTQNHSKRKKLYSK